MNYKNTVSGTIIGVMTIIIISLILFIVDLDIGVLNVLSLIAIDSFIIWVYFKFINFDKDELKLNGFVKRENVLIIFGLIIILVAVSTPFMIMWTNNYKYSLEFFEELGPIGDFFGGTTVGLLSLASLMFVTAAMFMQKEELALQRKEVTATRKEYEITNITMKKQSFDSTFFNMISLHQNILSQVKFKEFKGREAIETMYTELNKTIEGKRDEFWREVLFLELFPREKRESILLDTCNNINSQKIKSDFKKYINKEENEIRFYDDQTILYIERLYELEGILSNMLDNPSEVIKSISEDDNKGIFVHLSNSELLYNDVNLDEIKEHELNNLSYIRKKELYEEFYDEYENKIGHYYRNLYRIVKYIQEYEFSSNPNSEIRDQINFKERKEYRGILRAQLSSYELLMIFYNICYSEKGENFKELLNSTNFFDNHLVEGDFIWENDVNQLKYFKS